MDAVCAAGTRGRVFGAGIHAGPRRGRVVRGVARRGEGNCVFVGLAFRVSSRTAGGVGAFIGRFEECQKPPDRDHTGAACADERQRDAGERQNIRGAEDIERGLKEQHARDGARRDGVERGATACDIAAGVEDKEDEREQHCHAH